MKLIFKARKWRDHQGVKEEGKEKGTWDSALEQIRIQRLEKREGQVRKRLGGVISEARGRGSD